MPDATVGERWDAFARPDLSTFCRLDELGCLDGVSAIGVEERVWRHTRRGGKYFCE